MSKLSYKESLKAEQDKMLQEIVNSMTLLLGHNSLHQVLRTLSKGCMARCREMLNADIPKDANGNTLRALLDFSERIDRLADSAQSHNPDQKSSREMGESRKIKVKAYRDYKDDYSKGKVRQDDDDDIE